MFYIERKDIMNIDFQTIGEKVREAFNFEVMKLPLTGADNHYTPWYGLFRDIRVAILVAVQSLTVTFRIRLTMFVRWWKPPQISLTVR